MVWYFRGVPHVHTWVNVAAHPEGWRTAFGVRPWAEKLNGHGARNPASGRFALCHLHA